MTRCNVGPRLGCVNVARSNRFRTEFAHNIAYKVVPLQAVSLGPHAASPATARQVRQGFCLKHGGIVWWVSFHLTPSWVARKKGSHTELNLVSRGGGWGRCRNKSTEFHITDRLSFQKSLNYPKWNSQNISNFADIPYFLQSNPHPFYSFRGSKNQMRIRFAVTSWILEKW